MAGILHKKGKGKERNPLNADGGGKVLKINGGKGGSPGEKNRGIRT